MKLFDYQETGKAKIIKVKRMLLADDMGVGKTPQLIEGLKHTKRILVACPSTVRGVWEARIPEWDPGSEMVVARKPKDVEPLPPGTKWLVVNYESIRVHRLDANGDKVVDKKGNIRDANGNKKPGKKPFKTVPSTKIADVVFRFKPQAVVFDEGHNITNPEAAQTQGARILAKHAEYAVPATGTPILDGMDDLWTLLNLIDPKKWSSKWKFLQQHANAHPGMWGWEFTKGATDPLLLMEEIEGVFLRRTKGEVRDYKLPNEDNIYLDFTDEQYRLTKSFVDDMFAEISQGEHMVVTNALALLTRLRQVSVDPRLVGSKAPGTKIEALCDIVAGTSQKIVVFSVFTQAIALANEELNKRKVLTHVLTGDTPENQRNAIIKSFQTEGHQVFLANTAVGGPGIDLTAASIVVFLDRHYTPAINQQAVSRVDRYPQDKMVSVINLRTRGSVDDHIYDVNATKEEASSSLLDVARRYIEEFRNTKI